MRRCNWCGIEFGWDKANVGINLGSHAGLILHDMCFCSNECASAYQMTPEWQEILESDRARNQGYAEIWAAKENARPAIEKRLGHPVSEIGYSERLKCYVAMEELDAEIKAAYRALEKAVGLKDLESASANHGWNEDEKLWEFSCHIRYSHNCEPLIYSRPEHLAPVKAVCAYLRTKSCVMEWWPFQIMRDGTVADLRAALKKLRVGGGGVNYHEDKKKWLTGVDGLDYSKYVKYIKVPPLAAAKSVPVTPVAVAKPAPAPADDDEAESERLYSEVMNILADGPNTNEEALAAFLKAIPSGRGMSDSNTAVTGRLMYLQERYAEAVTLYESNPRMNLKQIYGTFAESYVNSLRRIKRFKDAIKFLDAVEKSHGLIAGLYYTRGACYWAIKDKKRAKADLKKAIEMLPEHEFAKKMLARIESGEKYPY